MHRTFFLSTLEALHFAPRQLLGTLTLCVSLGFTAPPLVNLLGIQ